MKQKQNSVTNEELAKFFDDNFHMTHYAIKYATQLITSGHEFTLSNIQEELKKKLQSESEKEVSHTES